AALVCKADIANTGAHIGKLPGPPTVLVIGAGRELPRDRCRVLDTPLSLTITLQEVIRCEGRLAHDLRDNFVVEQPRLELAAKVRGVLVDFRFGLIEAV